MPRSLKKGPYVNQKLLQRILKTRITEKAVFKTWDRACTITPEMVGYTIAVHNGKTHVPILIVENMVGHKFGEFVFTRKFVSHGGRMAKEQAKAAAEAGSAQAAPAAAPKQPQAGKTSPAK